VFELVIVFVIVRFSAAFCIKEQNGWYQICEPDFILSTKRGVKSGSLHEQFF
jgi:hypothetical protein